MPPKSDKMLRAEAAASADRRQPALPDVPIKVYKPGEEIPVKKVKCYNDFVAILQFRIDVTNVIIEGDSGFKNEGMVVGTGPGIPGPNGQRIGSQLNLGDVVTFYNNPVTALEPKSGVYAGQKVIIVSERSIICGLKKVPFKMVDDDPPQE